MKIVVNDRYTYECDQHPISIGDLVVLPSVDGSRWIGRVTSLISDYTGQCKSVIKNYGSRLNRYIDRHSGFAKKVLLDQIAMIDNVEQAYLASDNFNIMHNYKDKKALDVTWDMILVDIFGSEYTDFVDEIYRDKCEELQAEAEAAGFLDPY